MSNEAQVLSVFLHDTSVGTLTCLPTEQIVFAFSESYISDPNRPVLSLSYKEPLGGLKTKIKPTSVNLPPFFSNLLPEGKLRTYLAHKAHVKEAREFFLLRELSDDLPGAITLHGSESTAKPNDFEKREQSSKQLDGPLRFSLAGLQLKFSGDLLNNKLVIPAKGMGGHWIVKLPSPSFPDINELEYSMLVFASKIGITVPKVQLIPSSHVEGLPTDLPDTVDGSCLISCRYDRQEHGPRIHMEDFNQVFGLYDKYDPQFNYQSIAHVLWTEIGLDSVLEFVRRLVL